MTRALCVVAMLLLKALSIQTVQADGAELPEGALQHLPDQLPWRAGPPSMPPGTQMAVLEGDPARAGLFTLRLRVPAGAELPPHWHPQPERVTVLEGRLELGFGTQMGAGTLRTLAAGAYYVNPPGEPHFLRFPEAATVQITTEGPWVLHRVPTSSP